MCCVSSNPVYLPTSAVSGPILRRISSPIYPSSEGNTGREKAKSKDDSGTVENGRSDAPAEITDDVDEKKKFKQTETMAGYPTTRPERSSSLYGGGKALSNNRSHFSEGQLPITVPPVPNSVRYGCRVPLHYAAFNHSATLGSRPETTFSGRSNSSPMILRSLR